VSCNNATDPAERANQALRDCRAELAEAKRGAVTPAMLAEFEGGKEQRDRLRAALEKAESERDAALTDAEEWKQCSRDWRIRAESAESERDGVCDQLSALQAKVARAVALWDASLKARGAQYQIAESEFYEALEALR
jgi:hypothetical protein